LDPWYQGVSASLQAGLIACDTSRQMDRLTDGQMDRWTDGQGDRGTDGQMDRQAIYREKDTQSKCIMDMLAYRQTGRNKDKHMGRWRTERQADRDNDKHADK
jgi:hypothetical protein